MQKFIVQKVGRQKFAIGQKDLMLPFDKAIIDVKETDTIIHLYKLPIRCIDDPFPDYHYVVFTEKTGYAGFILTIREAELFDGYEPMYYPLSYIFTPEKMEELGWIDLDFDKYADYAKAVVTLILQVSHTCHHTSHYRSIKKKYERRELQKDITNPKPQRKYLSGNIFIEWVDDDEGEGVRKYVRHTEGWDVRGHYRYYKKSGKTVYVKPHHKGNPNATTTKEFYIKEEELHG